jgi:hypothetical protein
MTLTFLGEPVEIVRYDKPRTADQASIARRSGVLCVVERADGSRSSALASELVVQP